MHAQVEVADIAAEVVTAVVVTPVVADTNDNSSWKKWSTKGGAAKASLFASQRLWGNAVMLADLTLRRSR